MKDYSNLGLDNNLQKTDGMAGSPSKFVSGYDFGVNYQVPTGGLSFAQLNVDSRPYTAIVTLNKKQGTFENIKDAIEFVNNKGGGRILIMPGTYIITEDINLYSDISIEGLSQNDVIIDFNNSGSYSIKLDGTDTNNRINNVEIKKLTIKNNHNTTTGTIWLDWVDTLLIENVTFTDNRTGTDGYDIFTTDNAFGVHRLSIIRCKATGGATFLYARTGYDNVLRDCDITGYNNHVLYGRTAVSGIRHFNIVNNRFDSNSFGVFYGIFSFNNIVGNYLTGDVTNTESMVEITDGSQNSWQGNYIDSNNDSGTLIDFNKCGRNSFSNNTLLQKGTGYVVQIGKANNSTDFTFTGNEISTPNGAGDNTAVKITTAERTTFTGNIINGHIYGIDVDAGVDKTIIVGNAMYGGTSAIRDNGTNTLYKTATDSDPLNRTN